MKNKHDLDSMPLHSQIKLELETQLKEGRWKAGDLFPTDKQLMEQYNVSSTTVRRAIYELVQEGWVVRRSGKGTFVRKNMVEELTKLTGFFEEMEAKGIKASAQILKTEIITIDDELLQEWPALAEFKTAKVYLIRKIQKANGEPITFNHNFWPVDIGLEIIKYDLTQKGIYDIVQNELGIVLENAYQTIYAAEATEEEAQCLKIKENSPVLVMERATYSRGKVIEVSVNSYRPDSYRYRVVLNRETDKNNGGIFIKSPYENYLQGVD
ncbi:MAG: GntR family transcriptional regulator [Peptococcaceae bacterium]